MRLQNQWLLVQLRTKSGKFTKDQADSLRTNLKLIRDQELAFYKQNNKHQLTNDQQKQLNKLLNKNSKALGENPITSN